MFDPILVSLDGSLLAECVLPHVVAIARSFEAETTLLRILKRNQASASIQWQINKTGAGLALEKTRARLQAAGLRARTAVLEGLVAEGITEYAQNQGMKLIILSSHGRSGLTQWGLSSTLQKIVLGAHLTVTSQPGHGTELSLVWTQAPQKESK